MYIVFGRRTPISHSPSRRRFSRPCSTLPSSALSLLFATLVQALKEDLDHPVGVLASLVSSTISFGLPRAAAHLYLIGQIATCASHDRALATTLGNACFGRCDDQAHRRAPPFGGGSGTEEGSRGGTRVSGGGRGVATESGVEGEEGLGGFAPFLAAHAVSASCPDRVKSDVLYVAMELLDCCTVACTAATPQVNWSMAEEG